MARLSPVSRASFIKRLRKEWHWEGPTQPPGRKGGKHPEVMVRGDDVLRLPNEHRGDLGVDLLKNLLDQAGITRKEWLGESNDDDDDQHASDDGVDESATPSGE